MLIADSLISVKMCCVLRIMESCNSKPLLPFQLLGGSFLTLLVFFKQHCSLLVISCLLQRDDFEVL